MITTLFENPFLFLISAISIVIAVTIHEFAHALTADALGDPTPRVQGRVTLNPRAHLDPLGTIALLLVGFGWGRPVQFDPYNLRNPQKDAGLISIAGPGSNFVLALFCSILLKLLTSFALPFSNTMGYEIGTYLLVQLVYFNVILGVFNLLPVHPLDGFKIVGSLLPRERAHEWYGLERYGMIFLILLILPIGNGSLLSTIILPVVRFFMNLLLPGGYW
jgi:Zn-dependent protease